MTRRAKEAMPATCAIQVFTNPLVDEKEWQHFIQNLMDRWSSIKDPLTNRLLNARPHWGKDWPEKIRGLKARDYLKQEYKEFSKEFRAQLATSAGKGGYSLQDAFHVFGNDNILGIVADV